MHSFVFNLQETDKTKLSVAGGKGANLGELTRIGRINVPDGFCVSTEAYKRVIGESPLINALIDQLSLLKTGEHDKISKISREIREAIEQIRIPRDIADDITRFLMMRGVNTAYAVRSSATAEDLPTASFAGQQDTYLNVIGKDTILRHVTRCWASLFTDRAIIYRLQSGFDHRKVHLAVIVQQMIYPDAAGIMFTADPVTSNRKILSIDASFGLGEALVSGRVNPDIYKVREGRMVSKKISAKKLAIYAAKEGGTKEQVIDHELQNKQVLTDEQIFQLEHTGRKIEAHFGSPQDIEWCLADNTFYIVQSRPITTLFPVPEANDEDNHVYVSVGHQQMMTDPVRPLGISVWQLTGGRPMYNAGGRLFVDVAPNLATATGRQNILDVLGHSDPLIKDALTTIIERGDFIKSVPEDKGQPVHIRGHQGMSAGDILAEAGNDPAVVTDLIKQSEASLAALKHNIQTKSGLDVFDCIVQDMQLRRQRTSEAKNLNVIMAAIHASAWLNEKMDEWLGEKNAADAVSLSVPNNVTSEMGMELLDVADVIRPYPEIIKYLEQENGDDFLDELVRFEGGRQVRDAIIGYLDRYGMRCAGEIDIARTRWSEKPGILLPMILSNIRNVEPGASKRKFEQGRQQALKKEQDLSARLKALPDGKLKAEQTEKMIGLIRNFIGYREYPKYDIVSRYFVYKQALLKEAEGLVQAGVIHEKEDIYFLSFEELREVITTNKLNTTIISHRKDEYKFFEKLTPPRIITSDGEIITGKYKRENLPSDAFIGLAVSSGVIEGRARVVINIEDANLQEGDILITPFTDPSWTPIFLSIKGLVTEVGGLMTHGAVIAREYGLPAVVGLQDATKLIKDGQRIRVNGTEGYVEIL